MTAGERQARCCGRLHGGGCTAGSAGTARHFLARFGLGENFAFLATGRLATVRGRLATVRRSLTVRRRLAAVRGGLPTVRRRLATVRRGLPTRRRRLATVRRGLPTGRRRFATGRGSLPTGRRRLAARRGGLPTGRRRLAARRRGLPTGRRLLTARRGLMPARRRLPTGGRVPARRRLPTGRCLSAWWWLIPATRRRFAAGGLLFLAGLVLVGSLRRGPPATLRWWSPFRAIARATVVGPGIIPVVPSTASVVGPGITVVPPGVALAGPGLSVVRARVAMRRVAATGKCVTGAHQGEPERAGEDRQPQGCPPRASGTRLGKVHTFSLRGLHRRQRRRRPNPPGLTPRKGMSETAMPDVLPR